MHLTPLVEHLRQYCPSFAQRVAGGIDWEAIEGSGKLPALAAYVILTDEDADTSRSANAVIQDVREDFDVCVVFSADSERGQGVGDQVDGIRRELCRALVGWCPGEDYEPIQYLGRQLLLNNRARAVYRFSFFTEYQLGRGLPSDPPETWQEYELDGLPALAGIDFVIDAIDPADPNLKRPGPDGRIEARFSGDLP